jgi:hypothetical protein
MRRRPEELCQNITAIVHRAEAQPEATDLKVKGESGVSLWARGGDGTDHTTRIVVYSQVAGGVCGAAAVDWCESNLNIDMQRQYQLRMLQAYAKLQKFTVKPIKGSKLLGWKDVYANVKRRRAKSS